MAGSNNVKPTIRDKWVVSNFIEDLFWLASVFKDGVIITDYKNGKKIQLKEVKGKKHA